LTAGFWAGPRLELIDCTYHLLHRRLEDGDTGAMGESGEIYILKMGMPVKIIDMARDLILLSVFEPDKDIHIQITGLRPGKKGTPLDKEACISDSQKKEYEALHDRV